MRDMPPEKLAALQENHEEYTRSPGNNSPQVDQEVMHLRDRLAPFGVDLTEPDDFYVAWAMLSVAFLLQDRMLQLDDRQLSALEKIYVAMTAATPPELLRKIED